MLHYTHHIHTFLFENTNDRNFLCHTNDLSWFNHMHIGEKSHRWIGRIIFGDQ